MSMNLKKKRRKLSSTKGVGSEHFLLVMNSISLLSERFLYWILGSILGIGDTMLSEFWGYLPYLF